MVSPQAATAISACLDGKPADLIPYWQAVCDGEKRNQVLDHMRAGLAAMTLGHDELAEQAFDVALLGIEQIYAETESAEKARSVWHAESVKDFKGEPFERVMAYYYRGLLYLRRGDWENAQASFKAGVLQDTFAEEERFRADVASMIWLEGWANRCQGKSETADRLFKEAGTIRADLTLPAPTENLLVIAETGRGPTKHAGGRQSQKLVIREGFSGNPALVAIVNGKRLPLPEAEDLFFQASTRGGRAVDSILAEKAGTKETTKGIANAATTAGTVAAMHSGSSGNRNEALIGLGLILAGAIADAAANNMNANADTRTWDTLPHSIHLSAARPPDVMGSKIDIQDPSGRSLLRDGNAVQYAEIKPCSIAWGSSPSIIPSTPLTPLAGMQPNSGNAMRATGNCQAPSGKPSFADPASCARIGGTIVSPTTDEAASKGVPTVTAIGEGASCRTSTGALTFADPETCARIGGQFR